MVCGFPRGYAGWKGKMGKVRGLSRARLLFWSENILQNGFSYFYMDQLPIMQTFILGLPSLGVLKNWQ